MLILRHLFDGLCTKRAQAAPIAKTRKEEDHAKTQKF
jgi:hypothetical protein